MKRPVILGIVGKDAEKSASYTSTIISSEIKNQCVSCSIYTDGEISNLKVNLVVKLIRRIKIIL